MQYRSIRCSRASRRVRGGGGTSGPDRGGNSVKSLGRRDCLALACPSRVPGAYLAWRAPRWEPEAEVVVMVGLWAAGLGAEQYGTMRNLLIAPSNPRLMRPDQVPGLDQSGWQHQEVVSGILQKSCRVGRQGPHQVEGASGKGPQGPLGSVPPRQHQGSVRRKEIRGGGCS